MNRALPIGLLILSALAPAQTELVIHKEGTTLYHWAACPVVKDGRGVLALTRGQAEARAYKPHPACNPANAPQLPSPTDPAAAREPSRGKPAPPVFVQVDGSKYYHRETCRNLRTGSTRADLETAGKKLWPCPVCKPPIRRKSQERAVPHRIGR